MKDHKIFDEILENSIYLNRKYYENNK